MSNPTRTVTPRLEAAITKAVELMDWVCEEDPVTAATLDVGKARAELLEAFDEAREAP